MIQVLQGQALQQPQQLIVQLVQRGLSRQPKPPIAQHLVLMELTIKLELRRVYHVTQELTTMVLILLLPIAVLHVIQGLTQHLDLCFAAIFALSVRIYKQGHSNVYFVVQAQQIQIIQQLLLKVVLYVLQGRIQEQDLVLVLLAQMVFSHQLVQVLAS